MSPSPGLRLVAEGARLVRRRPAVAALALAGRAGAAVHVCWPDAEAPSIVAAPRAVGPNRWLRERFQPEARLPPGVDAATWVGLRSRAALVGGRPGLAVRLAEEVLQRGLDAPSVVVWSGSADPGAKANAFVWEGARADPVLVVRQLPDRRRSHRLRREHEMVAAVRARLAGHRELLAPLPEPALHAGELGGVFLTAERVDPLGGVAAEDPRDRVGPWLAGLQRATGAAARWTAADTAGAVDRVARAWELLRPARVAEVAARARRLLEELEGTPAPRCVQHGDLWRGNVMTDGPRMRVYDWEWAELSAPPFLDLWTYDLAEHRHDALHGRGHPRPLHAACAEVAEAVGALGVDRRFALASLAPALAQLTCRSRWEDAVPSGSEEGSIPAMAAVERLLATA